MRERLLKAWPVLASVGMLALAFPPFNVFLLVFVALAPWLASLRDTDGKGAFRSGYLFGFLYYLFQMWWLVPFLVEWTGRPALAVVPWIVCGFLAGWFFAVTGWLVNVCYRSGWMWLVPLVWAGMEGFRAYVPGLAFPWGLVATPLWRVPGLVQHAAFGTIFLVSAWAVLVSLVVVEVFFPKAGVERDVRRVLRMGVVVAGLLVLSAARFATPVEGTPRTFTLGQPGVDMAFTTPEEEEEQKWAAAPDLVAAALIQDSDLLILPEGFAGRVEGPVPWTGVGVEPPVPVLMGGQRASGAETFQTAYAWDGREWSHADKTRLVVFGEYVPFREQIPLLQQFNVPAGDLTAGTELVTMQVGDLRVGPLICFEGIFPDLAEGHSRQGAQILAQMSIDDWYERTPAYDQLWAGTVWRSIESGLPILRVGGRGRTLATDARGRLLVLAPVGERVGVRAEVLVPGGSDAFGWRMGFVWLCWALCLGVGVWGLFGHRSRFGGVGPGGV